MPSVAWKDRTHSVWVSLCLWGMHFLYGLSEQTTLFLDLQTFSSAQERRHAARITSFCDSFVFSLWFWILRVLPNHRMYHYRCHFNGSPDKMDVCAPYVRVPPNHRKNHYRCHFSGFPDKMGVCAQYVRVTHYKRMNHIIRH